MDKKQREKEFEEFMDMFAMPAWIKFQNEAQTLLDNLKDGAHVYADTGEKWQYLRGRMAQLEILANYETHFKASMEELAKQEQEDAEEDDAPIVI